MRRANPRFALFLALAAFSASPAAIACEACWSRSDELEGLLLDGNQQERIAQFRKEQAAYERTLRLRLDRCPAGFLSDFRGALPGARLKKPAAAGEPYKIVYPSDQMERSEVLTYFRQRCAVRVLK